LNTGYWNCSALVAEKYYKNNIILVGDSCHSFPPAGGFGMNTGL
jgi:putative polyketide hydroxylase